MNKPKLEDFYDEYDPRGCSTSEYRNYTKALDDYEKSLTIISFKDECREWLEPFGYSLHTSGGDGKYYHFTGEDLPSIECRIDSNGNKRASLSEGGFEFFLQLRLDDFQFKHPNLERFIDCMNYYIVMMKRHPFFDKKY